MKTFFLPSNHGITRCFYVDSGRLNASQDAKLRFLLNGPRHNEALLDTLPANGQHIEIGPRIEIETPKWSNIKDICTRINLPIRRIEESRIISVPEGMDVQDFAEGKFDIMTECIYPETLKSFESGIMPEAVREIRALQNGIKALEEANKELGLGWDKWDIEFVYEFVKTHLVRNPTDVELFQIAQMNSEHCRHWFFKGEMEFDGVVMPHSLLEIVQAPLKKRQAEGDCNSVIAFGDNSSAIRGYKVRVLQPTDPRGPSELVFAECERNILYTAETHNHPTMICPKPGAATGEGGCIRDGQCTGEGSEPTVAVAGYCVGSIYLLDFHIPGQLYTTKQSRRIASSLRILIDGSDGMKDYGNPFGIPTILGFTRSFGLRIDGETREFRKPVLFAGIGGCIDTLHLKKEKPEKGMLVIALGGPAYPVGVGGGSASSMGGGDNSADLDFASVQRGNPIMERKMDEVIRGCIAMGPDNPIKSIHDQGAGGPCNVVTEIVSPLGARINIRRINVGDKSMSVLKIWCAEAQERNALLIWPDRIKDLEMICEREGCPMEILGEVTGDGRITLVDSKDGTTPVDLPLLPILENIPRKRFKDQRRKTNIPKFIPPENLGVAHVLKLVMRLPSVGSKGFLTSKKDRSVGGMVVRQQCCGPLQLPVANCGIMKLSFEELCGKALAVGEQSPVMLVDPEAGARMSAAEAIFNIMSAEIDGGIANLKSSANWMWPAKMPGEAVKMYHAAVALRDFLIAFRGAEIDGGKDSCSLVVTTEEGEKIKSPGTLVLSVYGPMHDVRKHITPDIKAPGESSIGFLDLSGGKCRLGGSAFAQAFGALDNEAPDADPYLVAKVFAAVQELISEGLVLSGHDRSDGGLITLLSEMAMSGNAGIEVNLKAFPEPARFLFTQELGFVVEYLPDNLGKIRKILKKYNLKKIWRKIGETTNRKEVVVTFGRHEVFHKHIINIRSWWESTSDRLQEEQMNPELAKRPINSVHRHEPRNFSLSFTPQKPQGRNGNESVAIIRAEGTNGHREIGFAFKHVGFNTHNVHMSDLLSGKIDLERFRGIVFPGGFSYADVLGSAKGWAAQVKFNPRVKEMFDAFYKREDTFSLGVCNGCQLMVMLGLVPGPSFGEESPWMDHNDSGRFESDFVSVEIEPSKSIMFRGMEGSRLGVIVAHGEGKFVFPTGYDGAERALSQGLVPFRYTYPDGVWTEDYPSNPNGSPLGIAGLCSPCGRHTALMPHPERLVRLETWPWMPRDWKDLEASPWVTPFDNLMSWCKK